MKTQQQLEEAIVQYNEEYRAGNPSISDAEYDALLEELKTRFPDSELVKKAIIEEAPVDRMEPLPIPMYSLDKKKNIEDIIKWVEECVKYGEKSIVIMPKYDGISLCVDEYSGQAWTRGDGEMGQNSTDYKKLMRCSALNRARFNPKYTFGEAIFGVKRWRKIQEKTEYTTARNAVGGLLNAGAPSDLLRDVDYVRYGTTSDLNKSVQLGYLAEAENLCNGVKFSVMGVNNFTDTSTDSIKAVFEKLFKDWSEDYKIDGLVLEVDSTEVRAAMGRMPNGNPRYSIAYKNPEWDVKAETVVKKIEWKVSKDGKLKPVIQVEPVEINGVTISNVTGYNAKYIIDQHIAEESVIKIVRSGDVIPKHVETVKWNNNTHREMMDDMMICPSCGKSVTWDPNFVELVCYNPDCQQKQISLMVYGFMTLGLEEFGEPTLKKFWEAGYTTMDDVLAMTEEDMQQIPGVGKSLSKTIFTQLENLKTTGVPLAKLMCALNVFGGVIGEKGCQSILDGLEPEDLDALLEEDFYDFDTAEYREKITTIHGVGYESCMAFIQGLKMFKAMGDTGIKVTYIQSEKITPAENQMVVVFSGVRDAELEAKLIAAGHKVATGVSKNTTHLVVKDPNATTAKITKAKELGVKICTKEELEF